MGHDTQTDLPESLEHRAIIAALCAVDDAIRHQREVSSPAAIGGLLIEASAAIDAHRAATEDARGILAEMDVTHGRCESVTAARDEHAALAAEARQLSRMMMMSASPDRARLESFAQALRAHAVLLADLRLASHNLDIGVVD